MDTLLQWLFTGIFYLFLFSIVVAIIGWLIIKSIECYIEIRSMFSKKPDHYEFPTDDRTYSYENDDLWERFDFAGARIIPAFGDYNITYTDQQGMTTNRDISVIRAFENRGRHAVSAYCHLREDQRTFVDERISRAVDTATGEIVRSVARHAIDKFSETPEGQVLKAIDRETMALYLLAFVCRADGRMLKAERMIISDYLKRRCHDIDLDDTKLDNAIKTLGTPDKNEFKKIIADMKAAGDIERLRDITDCAKRIVATQKTVDPLEKAAIEILETASN